jgi:Helitron helicase-like domain at N-terminus
VLEVHARRLFIPYFLKFAYVSILPQVLGETEAYVYTVEFQKRGLPHAHILVFLTNRDQPHTYAEYDKFVSARLPCSIAQPELYELVVKHMLHGPCGPGVPNPPPCTPHVGGKCKYVFPRLFSTCTQMSDGGYPLYWRPDDGRFVEVSRRGVFDQKMHNGHVVPYNPALLLKYQSHLNVEICSTVNAVKYIHKYICKGHDVALVQVRRLVVKGSPWLHLFTVVVFRQIGPEDEENGVVIDEIQNFVGGRYVSAMEAAWRLLSFPMHEVRPRRNT